MGSAVWPFVARAASPMPVIGFLDLVARGPSEQFVAALRAGLAETGFEEGRNLFIDYRFADGDQNRLQNLAADLVRRKVAVIVTGGGAAAALAARAATTTIPIVFAAVADAREEGLVTTFNRPGGNATGISILGTEIDPKRFELLCEVVPSASIVADLRNPHRPNAEIQIASVRAAASNLKRQVVVLEASTTARIDVAFAALGGRGAGALVVLADPFFTSRRAQIVALAARHRIPAMYQWRDFVEAGGLMSYGSSLREAYHQAGIYTARILMGEKPADMPVLQPTKFELVINASTAKALGLALTEAMLSRADEVIE
jgi:putative ABC transport system substrate-binding protein